MNLSKIYREFIVQDTLKEKKIKSYLVITFVILIQFSWMKLKPTKTQSLFCITMAGWLQCYYYKFVGLSLSSTKVFHNLLVGSEINNSYVGIPLIGS